MASCCQRTYAAGTHDVAPPFSAPCTAPSVTSSSTIGAIICAAGPVPLPGPPPSARRPFRSAASCTGAVQPRSAPRSCAGPHTPDQDAPCSSKCVLTPAQLLHHHDYHAKRCDT